MKILVIDDQKLILLAVKKRLIADGYTVQTANSVEEGIYAYNSFQPDLVVLDMNMPEMSGTDLVECTGTEVVKYIRTFMKRKTPILVMSGNANQFVIANNYNLGVNEYLQKPISLNDLADRIKETLCDLSYPLSKKQHIPEKQIIKKAAIGLVVYCRNAEKSIITEELQTFAVRNLGYQLCFVNDASRDKSLIELRKLRDRNPSSVTLLNIKKPVGRPEAIRKGVAHLIKSQQIEYIGFLNAKNATDLMQFDTLVNDIETSPYEFVSRVANDGQPSTYSISKISSVVFDVVTSYLHKIPFDVINGGVKIMKREAAVEIFKEKFKYNKLFHLQLFRRVKEHTKLRREAINEATNGIIATSNYVQ